MSDNDLELEGAAASGGEGGADTAPCRSRRSDRF